MNVIWGVLVKGVLFSGQHYRISYSGPENVHIQSKAHSSSNIMQWIVNSSITEGIHV